MKTSEEIRAEIESRIESDEPDLILAVVKKLNGKPVSIRILDKLPGGRERWWLRKEYGMTHIEENRYVSPAKERSYNYSYLVGHSEGGLIWDVTDFEARNPGYYAGRNERNEARTKALNDPNLLERFAEACNDVTRRKAMLEEAVAAFNSFLAYGLPLSPDNYYFQKDILG